MSLTRLFRWECNVGVCFKHEDKSSYGFPEGWKYWMKEGILQHACPSCAEAMLTKGWVLDDKKQDFPDYLFFQGLPLEVAP